MKPGDKIVCINAKFHNVANDQGLREGTVYTVRWYGPQSHYIDGDYYGVQLDEIVRGEDPAGYCEPDLPFNAARFRPVVSPKKHVVTKVEERV